MSKKNDLSESVQRKYNDTENKWFMQNNEKIEFIIKYYTYSDHSTTMHGTSIKN